MTVSYDQDIEVGNFAPRGPVPGPHASIRVVDWNINRGLQLSGIIEFLSSTKADLILLQEVDLNARRTRHLNIAREISQKLEMNYVFGREFQELTQGRGHHPLTTGRPRSLPGRCHSPAYFDFAGNRASGARAGSFLEFRCFKRGLADAWLW
jgi:hypothetical protein